MGLAWLKMCNGTLHVLTFDAVYICVGSPSIIMLQVITQVEGTLIGSKSSKTSKK